MRFENLEEYVDDKLAMELSEGIYAERCGRDGVIQKSTERVPSDDKRIKEKRVRISMLAAAACAVMVLGICNMGEITAAAKGLAVFLFGGIITEENMEDYYVLKEPVEFGAGKEYRLELAYRDGGDVYAVVTRNSADGVGEAVLEVDGHVYEDTNRGSSSYTVSEAGGMTGEITREKSEAQYHFEQVQPGNSMKLTVDGRQVYLSLETPMRSAGDYGPVMVTSDTSWIIWPLVPDCSIVGVSLKDAGKLPWLKDAESIELLDPVFIGISGKKYRAEPVGEDNHVWKTADHTEEEMIGFQTAGISYTLADNTNGLASYTCRVPERNGKSEKSECIWIQGLELKVKRVERSGLDHISLYMEPQTAGGELHSGQLRAEKAVGYGSASGGDEFSLTVDYSYHIMEEDKETVKETVYNFPYRTGEEMTMRIGCLELYLREEAQIMFRQPPDHRP